MTQEFEDIEDAVKNQPWALALAMSFIGVIIILLIVFWAIGWIDVAVLLSALGGGSLGWGAAKVKG